MEDDTLPPAKVLYTYEETNEETGETYTVTRYEAHQPQWLKEDLKRRDDFLSDHEGVNGVNPEDVLERDWEPFYEDGKYEH